MELCIKLAQRRRTKIFVTMGWFGLLSMTTAWVSTSPDRGFYSRRSMRRTAEGDGGSPRKSHRPTPPARPMFGQAVHRNHTITSVTTTGASTKAAPPSVPGRPRRNTDAVRSDSSVLSLHIKRLQNAGRVGTKRFVNPCKVFIGNISFQVQSAQELRAWVIQQMGLPEHVLLKDCQLITEWKTGKSKGYGFVLFTEPIYATMAITKLNGMQWYDRPLSVLQGVQQKTLEELSLSRERASRERNTTVSLPKEEEKPSVIYMDAQEAAMLRHLDPDLLEGVRIVTDSEKPGLAPTLPDSSLDVDYDEDDDDEEDYDDSDDGVDGIWYEDDVVEDSRSLSDPEETKNRQQRRDSAKGKKKIKRPRKGFGA